MDASKQRKIDSGFAARSEPAQILAGVDLTGKVAVVTGGYSGIGLETTRALHQAGARVHVPVRDKAKAQKTLAGMGDGVTFAEMDLSDLNSVRRYAQHCYNDVAAWAVNPESALRLWKVTETMLGK